MSKPERQDLFPFHLTSCSQPEKCQVRMGPLGRPELALALRTWPSLLFAGKQNQQLMTQAPAPTTATATATDITCVSPGTKEQVFGLRWPSEAASNQFLFPRLSPAVMEASALRVNIPTLQQALWHGRHKCLLSH